MHFAKHAIVIILYFENVLSSHTKICIEDDFKKIEDDKDVELECHINETVRMTYKWRNTKYLGLNPNASLEKIQIPVFHENSSVSFKDLKILHGYPTLRVKSLSLINVYINYDGKSFLNMLLLKLKYRILLHVDKCVFVDEDQLHHGKHENFLYVFAPSFNISISNSIFSRFNAIRPLSFISKENHHNSIIFANNSIIYMKKLHEFIMVSRSTLIFSNNKIKFNANIEDFIWASNSNISFCDNSNSRNFNIRHFFNHQSRFPTKLNISNNHIKFNFIKVFLFISEAPLHIQMTHNLYLENKFDNIIFDTSSIKNNYVLDNEEFSMNNFTLFAFNNGSGNVTISNSKFKFGGFYQSLTSCPLIDVKQLKSIRVVSSKLTACDASIQKRIHFLCGEQYTVRQVECFRNIIKCDTNDYSLLKVVFPTGFAVLIGWIILNVLTMKVKKQWKKLFDKSTQTQLPGDNESDFSAKNFYESID